MNDVDVERELDDLIDLIDRIRHGADDLGGPALDAGVTGPEAGAAENRTIMNVRAALARQQTQHLREGMAEVRERARAMAERTRAGRAGRAAEDEEAGGSRHTRGEPAPAEADAADSPAAGVGAPGVGAAGVGVDDAARRRRVLALLDHDGAQPWAGQGGTEGRGPGRSGVPDEQARLARVCAMALPQVGVDGAGITVMGRVEDGRTGARAQLAATGALTRRLEDLQLTTGEGPCLDACRGGRPVLVRDLAVAPTRWWGFGPEAVRVGAAALFSLPLQVGAVRLGALDLHRLTPGPLTREQLADALILASLATEVLLELAEQLDHAGTVDDAAPGADLSTVLPAGWLPDVHADVHVAAGMASARAGVDVTTALLRLRAYAFARAEPLHLVARRIIDGDLVLDLS